MGALKIAGFAIAAAAAALTVRSYKPELGLQIGLATGLMLLLYALDEVGGVFSELSQYVERFGISSEYIAAMLKVTGIVYLIQFAAEACRDCGEGAIAAKTELAGRVMILVVCLPVIKTVFKLIASVAGGVP